MRHVGGALAAMTSDYRGNPVEIPEGDRRAVMKKILARKAKLEQEESSFRFLSFLFFRL